MLQIPNQGTSGTNVFWLVCNWLRYEANNGWLMFLDNADDKLVFENQPRGECTDATGVWSGSPSPLSVYLPQTSNGLVLVTSRNRSPTFRLVGNHKNIMAVWLMSVYESSILSLARFSGICTQDDVKNSFSSLSTYHLQSAKL